MANIKDTQKQPLHPAQMRMLAHLLTLPKARFKDLKLPGFTTKHLTYHINKLIELGLLKKTTDKTYYLTNKGKKFVMNIDIYESRKGKNTEYSKRSVMLRAITKINGVYKWLFYKRLKHPFYGYVGLPAGKVTKGEAPLQTAIREFTEETNLTMRYWELIKIEHDIIYKKTGELEYDIYYYTFDIYDPEGTLRPKCEEGEYFWVNLKEISKLKLFPDLMNLAEKETHWTQMPKRYEKFLKQKQKGTWKNKPETWEKIQQIKTTYIEWPYEVDEI